MAVGGRPPAASGVLWPGGGSGAELSEQPSTPRDDSGR